MPPDQKRQVLVHYHLFKNGGTSLERLLQHSFGKAWASYDKEQSSGRIAAAEMQHWIEKHPEIKAVSSHHVVPPIPRGEFDVTPLVFLRHPLLRARSAWLFEWQKQPGLKRPKGRFSEYVEEKLNGNNSGVISNFQVSRLGCSDYATARSRYTRHAQAPLYQAIDFVDSLPFFGLVEDFPLSLRWMAAHCRTRFPDLVVREYQENVLEVHTTTVEERIEQMRKELGFKMFNELCLRNEHDLQLYQYAVGRFKVLATRYQSDARVAA